MTSTDALGFPGGASGKESICQCRRHKRHRSDSWVGKIPWRRARQPTPVFLPRESHGQRSLVGYNPWGHKQSDVTERTHCTRVHPEGQGHSSLESGHLPAAHCGLSHWISFFIHPGSQLSWIVCKDGEIWGPLSC